MTTCRITIALCAGSIFTAFAGETGTKNACVEQPVELRAEGPAWNGWGAGLGNSHFETAGDAGLDARDVAKLKLKWAFGFPGDVNAYSQAVVFGGRIFVGSEGGTIYSLDAKTGCGYWSYEVLSGVRAAITIAASSGHGYAVYAADQRANVYALNASTGKLIWKVRVDDHPEARITGSPQFFRGTLYVPVASGEEWAKADPAYECCTFRGSVAALDAESGRERWKTYTIAQKPREQAKSRGGTQLWGPSGASVWGAPAIDAKRNALYIATGANTSEPAASTSDSILALDLESGKILWSRQLGENSIFSAGCIQANRASCPDSPGPDHDFVASPILLDLGKKPAEPEERHRLKRVLRRACCGHDWTERVLIAAQKSGLIHALDPDDEGEIVWQQKVGKGGLEGGIEWGAAADEKNVYAPLSDLALDLGGDKGFRPSPAMGGGLFALRLSDGKKIWSAAARAACERPGCSPAQTAAAAVIPGVVFSGALDGHLRAYSTADGAILWDYDTARDYPVTVNGVPAKGGGIDGPSATIAGGMVYVNSGFGQLHGMPGNVLLAFGVE